MSIQITIYECRYGPRCTNNKCERMHPGDRIVVSIPEDRGQRKRASGTTRVLHHDKSSTSHGRMDSSRWIDSGVKKTSTHSKSERPICRYGPNCSRKDNGCKFKH